MLYDHWSEIPAGEWPSVHFKPPEIACRGTGAVLINVEALDALDYFRSLLGSPVHLSSAFRSPYHNACIGGAPRSSHLKGHAFDIQLRGMDKETVRRCAEQSGFKGFGMRYKTFVHIDMGRRRTW